MMDFPSFQMLLPLASTVISHRQVHASGYLMNVL
jgi:hypothetical protein